MYVHLIIFMQDFSVCAFCVIVLYLAHLKVAKMIKFTSFFLLTILTIELIKFLFLRASESAISVLQYRSVCKYFSACFLVLLI